MRANTQSKRGVPGAGQSSIESFSEVVIRKELRSDAVQHPTTILPLALFVMSIIYLALYSPVVGAAQVAIVVLICSGILAAGSFLWHYTLRYHTLRYHEGYERRVQELIAVQDRERKEIEQAELEQIRDALQTGFSSINSTKGLEALNQLVHEFDQLRPVLDRRKDTDPLSLAHIGALAEQTYRQGLSVLQDAFMLTRVIRSANKEGLESEIRELEREIEALRDNETQAARIRIREETVTSHKERLEMIEQQLLREDELLQQADRCEAALARARIELAALKAESSATSVSAVNETLQSTIDRAKEVQEELRRLGY
jgi:hypothetical protein